MKSKKWTLVATSLTAMVLMTACAQSTTTSNTKATTNSATTTSTKTNQLSYFTDKDNDATSSPEIVTDGDGLAVFDP